jgi:hypothetical protein
VPQSLYKDILDAILPASNDSIVNLDSKIAITTAAPLNATAQAPLLLH